MSSERTEQFPDPRISNDQPVSDASQGGETTSNNAPANDARHTGSAVLDDGGRAKATPDKNTKAPTQETKAPAKEVSADKVRMQIHLPALEDDAAIGMQREQTVTRDGKADLGFTGVLLASAAPDSATKGRWQEYRIYQTSGGKHVFSKVTRTVFAEEDDAYEAEVFDPAPTSVPSQLLRSAREMARSKPLTWIDAAVAFFGYDPLAKTLYRKLSVQFEEQIS